MFPLTFFGKRFGGEDLSHLPPPPDPRHPSGLPIPASPPTYPIDGYHLQYGRRLTQAQAIAHYIDPSDAPLSKFCGYCGSWIRDRKLREWHSKNEHPGATSPEMIFCLVCGDHIGPTGAVRAEHYKGHRLESMASR